ncbi:RtcB family protein [Thiofilum flexile]|uniref:RtcB family protein n=1 Tax=Thiofilum flexile TaxID=125627 RepID=UPI00036A0EB9|nr:RtcB family protein [Thiofilum flexile]
MPIQFMLNTGKVPVKVYTSDVDNASLTQLGNMAQLPFIHSHIAAMPDVHVGTGATVGSVIPTRGAIIPAAVGVDIGCGMNAVRLSLKAGQLPDNLYSVRNEIEKRVPVGFNEHRKATIQGATLKNMAKHLNVIADKHAGLVKMLKNFDHSWGKQLGTLGGGNHFIELCIDESEDVWVMLHSGSRGIGNAIGRYFIEKAKKDVGRELGQLPDQSLAYFTEGTQHFDDYIEAVGWAQDYAMTNRREMLRLVLDALQTELPAFTTTREAINCHHNYVEKETHFGAEVYVTRKGAISAQEGELGIIPGSMGAKSYIVRGLGNEQSFCSCSHGAGRRMSRTEARRRFNTRDLIAQTNGVECRKDKNLVDEIPGAYKDIDVVMQNQIDLVEVVHTLKQVICIKG